MACVEGSEGTAPTYRERLTAPWWLWVAAAIFVLSVVVAYGFALGTAAAMIAGLLIGAGTAGLLLATTITLRVDECVVRAGRARLPLRFAGAVEVLNRDACARARTVDYDPSAHVVLRTWSSGRAVRLAVTDPRDPHPFWLISAKDPDALAAAIRSGAESAKASGQSTPERAG